MENKNLENLPVENEKIWEMQERIDRHHQNVKSRYPPFSIEPFATERERLARPMTDAERAMRKQWLLDQRLAPHEPPNSIIALETMNLPANPLKRALQKPMDAFCNAIKPVVGPGVASGVRKGAPPVMKVIAVGMVGFYYVKYGEHSWETNSGIHFYKSKPLQLYGRTEKELEPSDFGRAKRGFKTRTVLLDGKTSANSELAA